MHGVKICLDLEGDPGFPGCCDSCHDSAYYSDDLFEVVLPDGTAYLVCCRVRYWLWSRLGVK